MIGIYQARDHILFLAKGKGEVKPYRTDILSDEMGRESLRTIFEEARKEVGFTRRDDFRLLLDFPLSHCVSQSVPFPEKQLGQVLENYLEEELPENIENFVFDYQLLYSKEQRSSVLGFWMRRDLLKLWCELADELSLNSLDIQPAELALLPDSADAPSLLLREDHQKLLRFSCMSLRDGLPHLCMGRLSASLQDHRLTQTLQLMGPEWSEVREIRTTSNLSGIANKLKEQLGIARVEILKVARPEIFFLDWALEDKTTAVGSRALQYRRGEFAQRGLGEKILIPVMVIALALFALLLSQVWSTQLELKRQRAMNEALNAQTHQVWKKLFPGVEKPRNLSVLRALQDRYNQMTIGDLEDDANISALQAMGLLFKYIESYQGLNIETISISNISVSIKGTADTLDTLDRLEAGFNNEAAMKDFNKPNKNHQAKEKGFQFTFSTTLVVEK